ncbi:MAG: phosphatase PAP2 family protein [Sphaerochaetaceae bacterium]|nr:phosphatase PAP2 family protein [Sphaerochaetaceae bacterium]
MKESKRDFMLGACFFALFILLAVLLRKVDYRAIGPMDSSVGFATLNAGAAAMFPYNGFWYVISVISGILNYLIAGLFAISGLKQLVSRRSLLLVDKKLVYLGALYAVVIFLYLIFDHVVVINFRPVLEDGALAPSFPSSHSFMAVSIVASAAFLSSKGLSIFLPKTKRLVLGSLFALMIISVFSRLFSGVHWLTDIIGGVLLGFACVYTYAGSVLMTENK